MVDTTTKILDAAERLFAERGYGATSLRAVTEEAGVNLAAVNYHFGSKQGLLRAAFQRLATPTNEKRLRELDDLEARGKPPRLEDLLESFLAPALQVVADLGPRGRIATRFLGRTAADPTDVVQQMLAEEFQEVTKRYVEALGSVLPDLDREELLWRFKLMVGVLIYIQTDEDWKDRLASRPSGGGLAVVRDRTIRFLSAGLRADSVNP